MSSAEVHVEVIGAEYGSEYDLPRWVCRDYEAALQHAIGNAKYFEGKSDAPQEIRLLKDNCEIERWTVNELLTFAYLFGAIEQ
jgi:hypothetical protein